MNTSISSAVKGLNLNLDRAGNWVAPLALRVFLAWEFLESGLEKLNGQNWFTDIQERFPFPFDHLPATLNWDLSMWAELIFPMPLLLGLGTRFSALSLMVVPLVAPAAIHWPAAWRTLTELAHGYAISSTGCGNFERPLIYLVAFTPLLLSGGGELSVDGLVARCCWRR